MHGSRVVAMIASAVLAGSLASGAPLTASAATPPAPTPVVQGARLVDSRTGAVFVPRGVDFPSFEYACSQGWGYSNGGDTAAAAKAMHDWGVTTVRLPLNEGCWTGQNSEPAFGDRAGYQSAVRSWVATLHSQGIVVILDLHWTRPPGAADYEQYAAPSTNSLAFWTSVAGTFASDPSVMFDLFNEPYSVWDEASNDHYAFSLDWSCWRDGGCHPPTSDQNSDPSTWHGTYTAVGMQQLVTAVRAAGARQPIVLSGLDYANDLGGWWAHRPDDAQLVAGYHGYEGNLCSTTACWSSTLAALAQHVPIIAGEFGSTSGHASYLTDLMTWADAHGMGYLAWAWWGSDSDGGPNRYITLLADDTTFAPASPIGTTLRSHLLAIAHPTTAPAPPRPAPKPASRPARGSLVAVGKVHRGHFTASGWALDPDTTKGAVRVTVSIDGKGRTTVTASKLRRPAPGNGAWGAHHGFSVRLLAHRHGRHRVCATALDYHGTKRTPLGCLWVRT